MSRTPAALLDHINEDCLQEAFDNLKKHAAVGIDEMTWRDEEQDLEANIVNLDERIHRGVCRAKPSLRVRIPKPDGRERLLGIASVEDKIVQQATVWVLQAICEQTSSGSVMAFGLAAANTTHLMR